MTDPLDFFEHLTRKAHQFSHEKEVSLVDTHPFELRNVHPVLPIKVRELFDDGHFSQATFEAFKFIENQVKKLSGLDSPTYNKMGYDLMMEVFSETKPVIKLTNCSTLSERNEQNGYRFMFAGAITGIRNPRGHEYNIQDSMDECLDYLSLASVLIRRLESAGYKLPV